MRLPSPKDRYITLPTYIPAETLRIGHLARGRILRFDLDVNLLGPSPRVREAVERFLEHGSLNLYPDLGCSLLCEEVSRRFDLPSTDIVFANGSAEILRSIFKVFVKERSRVLIPAPSWEPYRYLSALEGASVIESMLLEHNSSFIYDLRNLKKIAPTCETIILCTPNNPTGNTIAINQLEHITKLASKSLVVIDEAFMGIHDISASSLIMKNKNIIVVRSLSKIYGLAGLRIGYAIASERLTNFLKKDLSPVNSLSQEAALAALKDDEYYQTVQRQLQENKSYLMHKLKDIQIVERVYDSHTFSILVRFEPYVNLVFVLHKLANMGIFVRDCSRRPLLNNSIRITVGNRSDLAIFLTSLDKISDELETLNKC